MVPGCTDAALSGGPNSVIGKGIATKTSPPVGSPVGVGVAREVMGTSRTRVHPIMSRATQKGTRNRDGLLFIREAYTGIRQNALRLEGAATRATKGVLSLHHDLVSIPFSDGCRYRLKARHPELRAMSPLTAIIGSR